MAKTISPDLKEVQQIIRKAKKKGYTIKLIASKCGLKPNQIYYLTGPLCKKIDTQTYDLIKYYSLKENIK